MKANRLLVLPALAVAFAGWWAAAQTSPPTPAVAEPVVTVPGMPPVVDPTNLYSETAADRMSPAVEGALPRIYVPNRRANSVTVIDPATLQVVDTFKVGYNPQHVVPSWDLKTLWVANNAEGRTDGSLTPVDPLTGKPGEAIPVDDPYNLYWTPDGRYAIVVAEEHRRLDFRDPHTMKSEFSLAVPKCGGVNHADFSIDGTYALFTCEFDGAVTKIDMVNKSVVGTLVLTPYYQRADVVAQLEIFEKKPAIVSDSFELGGAICATRGMPQDIRVSPDGKLFYVADMLADGVHVVDGASFRQVGFIPTGLGAHGLYPSRDGKLLYVANRGSNKMLGPRRGKGSVSVIDFSTQKVVDFWPVPGGGSPDMGNVSADGRYLWLSGRFDDVVYRFDTSTGAVDQVKVGREPHGLAVWPQPGRYSLGHTGNMR
ncbi:YncE family protein [Reyranella sp.]|jgi:YVTN family beta-propeller protein|uniref:YncE family protein n=1 Tax=Reyranella sp. TaxID=1929291 RepID=UPI002F95DDF5